MNDNRQLQSDGTPFPHLNDLLYEALGGRVGRERCDDLSFLVLAWMQEARERGVIK